MFGALSDDFPTRGECMSVDEIKAMFPDVKLDQVDWDYLAKNSLEEHKDFPATRGQVLHAFTIIGLTRALTVLDCMLYCCGSFKDSEVWKRCKGECDRSFDLLAAALGTEAAFIMQNRLTKRLGQ